MSTRVSSDTLPKSSRIRAQQAILSLSLNISLICFASSRSYVPSRTCKSWLHVITDRFPSTTTCAFISLSTKQSISPTSFISHRTTAAWSSPQAEYLARAHLRGQPPVPQALFTPIFFIGVSTLYTHWNLR